MTHKKAYGTTTNKGEIAQEVLSMPQLIDFREGAKELKVSIHTLRGWAHKRRIPYVRLGRRVLLKREDLEAFIDKNVMKAKDEGKS